MPIPHSSSWAVAAAMLLDVRASQAYQGPMVRGPRIGGGGLIWFTIAACELSTSCVL